MTARVNDAIDTIAAAWIALTPPTEASITYHHLDDDQETTDTMADRGFLFEGPEQGEIIAESATSSSSITRWSVQAKLLLDPLRYGRRGLSRAMANEGNLFVRAVDRLTSWPAGVLEVITEPFTAETLLSDDETIGIVVLVFGFSITCEETD